MTLKMNEHNYYFKEHPFFRKALSPRIFIKKWIDDKMVV